jgi:hypothetical protein
MSTNLTTFPQKMDFCTMNPTTNEPNLTQYKGKERRSASRLSCASSCHLTFEDGLELSAKIQNISFTGTFLQLNYLEKASLVNLRVWLAFELTVRSHTHTFRVNGMVVRATEAGIGIAFRQTEKALLEPVIQKLMDENEERTLTLTSQGVE